MKCYIKQHGNGYYSIEVFVNNLLTGTLEMTLKELNVFKETCSHVLFIEV